MNTNYSAIEQNLVKFLRDETAKAGIKKAVIGLSGGIDSAVSAFLSAKAFGPENVLGVLMPYKTSSRASVTDAERVVKALGIRSKKFEITDMVDSYISKLEGDVPAVRKGNVMARMRMIVLYDNSAVESGIVIGTGNKTEIYLGYTTLFGDSACGINPVGNLYKTQIFGLAKYMGVPEEILNKRPSADLWEGQTDEGEMGILYAEVDKYLYAKFDEGKSDDELIKMGFGKEYIEKINGIIAKNEFKRLPVKIGSI
ncbi:MAG: NAD+ synthase [Bacteroidetes bacterium]|nr:NAD+ synthase [Bacteroidota bacterium]